MGDKFITLPEGGTVTYAAIREAQGEEPYPMILAMPDAKVVEDIVNAGIDSHLEACYCPDLGDSYEWTSTEGIGAKLDCTVSPKSLPTLLRRLLENEIEDEEDSFLAMNLGENILLTLGFDHETGEHVGREALGLE